MLRSGVLWFGASRCCIAVVRIGLSVLVTQVGWGLGLQASSSSVASSLSLSAASKVSPSCGSTIPTMRLQQDLEAQLRSGGISVSRVHTANLVTDIDCVSRNTVRRQGATVGVRQCLALSQIVSPPSQTNSVSLVTAWQKCDSYNCATRKCGTIARSRLHTLASAFIADLYATGSASSSVVHFAQPELPRLAIAREEYRDPHSGSRVYQIAPELIVAYYVSYLATCCAVMLRWLQRQHQFH